jgi:mRNA interferase MazF
MNRGDVWWCDIGGLGPRPVVILTRDSAIPLLTSVVVATLTQTIRGVPTEVIVESREGVPKRSVISLDNIYTVFKADLRDRITSLTSERLQEICEALRYSVAC